MQEPAPGASHIAPMWPILSNYLSCAWIAYAWMIGPWCNKKWENHVNVDPTNAL